MPVILLIRHGQASFGATDYDVLSDLGAEQLTALHRSLRDETNVQALVSGDLRRQRDSARPWTRDGAALAIDDRWNEYDSDDVIRAYGESEVSFEASEGERHAATSRQFQEALDVASRSGSEHAKAATRRSRGPRSGHGASVRCTTLPRPSVAGKRGLLHIGRCGSGLRSGPTRRTGRGLHHAEPHRGQRWGHQGPGRRARPLARLVQRAQSS